MAPSTRQVRAATASARSKGWLMVVLRLARTVLASRRTLRPEDLSTHLQRDIGLLDRPDPTGRLHRHRP